MRYSMVMKHKSIEPAANVPQSNVLAILLIQQTTAVCVAVCVYVLTEEYILCVLIADYNYKIMHRNTCQHVQYVNLE